MAFRATNIIPQDALKAIKAQVVQLLRLAQNRKTVLLSNTGADVILAMVDALLIQQANIDALKDTPGLVAYAKAQENDADYDIVTEFVALDGALDDVVAEITSTFPAATFLTLNPDGTKTFQQLTPAQTANRRTKLDVVIAAIS